MKDKATDLHQQVIKTLSERYVGPLIDNSERGKYMETVVAELLDSDWVLTWQLPEHSTWSNWDIQNQTTGTKIEVKQSAACQTWRSNDTSRPRFDIKEVCGYWGADNGEGEEWINLSTPRRLADLYIFAWHPVANRDRANHIDFAQWEFYVVEAGKLPKGQKTIGLQPLKEIADCVDYRTLNSAVEKALSAS